MARWPTAKHFTSSLTLAPQNFVSGGRLLSSRTQPSATRGCHLSHGGHDARTHADRPGRVLSARGLPYRQAQGHHRHGPQARRPDYRMLKDHLVYIDPGAEAYEAQDSSRVVRRLRQRAEHLGFGLVNLSTGEVIEGAVS